MTSRQVAAASGVAAVSVRVPTSTVSRPAGQGRVASAVGSPAWPSVTIRCQFWGPWASCAASASNRAFAPPGAASAAGAEFAPHLARHGVNVSVNVLPVVDDVAETLRAQVGLFRADMLVMGAYRHPRLQEWFLGGATRSLLTRSPVPLFLAH